MRSAPFPLGRLWCSFHIEGPSLHLKHGTRLFLSIALGSASERLLLFPGQSTDPQQGS